MDFETALVNQVRAFGFAAIYPVQGPEDVGGDRLVYQVVSDEPVSHLKGESLTRRATVHFFCLASLARTTREMAERLAGNPRGTRLASFRGYLKGSRVFVQYCGVGDRTAEYDLTEFGGDEGHHVRLVEAVLVYNIPEVG